MIRLEKNVKVQDIVSCPALGVCFICETEADKELVKRFNEQTKFMKRL